MAEQMISRIASSTHLYNNRKWQQTKLNYFFPAHNTATPPVNDVSLPLTSCQVDIPQTPDADIHSTKEHLSAGCKYVIDNYDMFQKVRTMTEINQNRDIHWVNHNRVSNRVSGNHLQDNTAICDLKNLDNSKLTPSVIEHIMQRNNYITLIERILVSSINYLKFCNGIVSQQIPHKHVKESGMKSKKVSLPFINKFILSLIINIRN